MTYEDAIIKIAVALVYEKGMTPQETARAAAEAIGLREMMEALRASEQRFATLRQAYDRERNRPIQLLGSKAPAP
jgi:hypothetical protein